MHFNVKKFLMENFQRAIESKNQIIQYLLGLEIIFIDFLKSRVMTIAVVPLKTLGKTFNRLKMTHHNFITPLQNIHQN